MKIEIVGTIGIEPVAIGNAICKCLTWAENNNHAIIYVSPRLENGWLEYGLSIQNEECKQVIFIAMIQREINLDFEFHS